MIFLVHFIRLVEKISEYTTAEVNNDTVIEERVEKRTCPFIQI